MLRRILAVLGLLFAGVGIAVALVPSIADIVRLPDIPTVVVGALAVVLAVATFTARKRIEFRDPAEASVRASGLESRFEPPRPGEEVDEQLANAQSLTLQLRERLRILAVSVLTESEGWSEEEATRRLQDGTWTEDRTAAALLSDKIAPPAQDVIVTITGIESAREREVRHVVAELEKRSGVEMEGGD